MAKRSVAIPSLSINPVSHLSYLIEDVLQDSCNESSDFHENYRRQFATVIGLAFAAILAKGNCAHSNQWHMLTFWCYGNDFTQCTDRFERLSVIVAELICNALMSFKFLGMPRYFDDFVLAMTYILYPANMDSMDKKRNIRDLLQTLFEKCD
jgi:hypothetical protein